MGGTITLDSTFGAGTKMTIMVPFDKAPLDTPGSLSASDPATPSELTTAPATAFADSPGLRHSATSASKAGKASNQAPTNGEIAEVLAEPERRRRSKDARILLAEGESDLDPRLVAR